MVKIVNMFIPKSNTFTRPGRSMTPTSITIHETDNPNIGANALAHARLQVNGNRRQASWHFQVDDGEKAYLSIPLNEVAYHAGNRQGNYSSIAIEICVNRDGNYKKAVENAVKVVRYIMRKYPNIKKSHIKQHYDWSKKNCPRQLRNGRAISWQQFVQMINGNQEKQTLEKKSSQQLKQGMKVLLKLTASTYATGEKIPAWVKGKQYTIQQIKGKNVLLKEIYSWVRIRDVSQSKSNSTIKKKWEVGGKVQIKQSAKKYSRSTVNIPNLYKEITYTIQQVSSEDILIKELYSWVKKKDVNFV